MRTTKTKTTPSTSRSDACYYANETCGGDSWQCSSCREFFCQNHSHVTEKGHNKECVACERERKDAKQLDAEDAADRLSARADPGDKLDIADK